MTNYLLVTLGSWGDLFPFIGIATELRRRGHEVTIAGSPAWQNTVADTGVEYLPIGREIGFAEFKDNPEVFARMPFGLRAALDRFMFAQADELTTDLRAAVGRADVVVVHPAHVVALNLAEALDKTVVVASVFPAMIPSAYTVPSSSLGGPWHGPVGRLANRASWATATLVVSGLFDRKINAHRRSLGLARMRAGLVNLPLQADKVLLLCSRELIEQPPDWPDRVVVTGAATWDAAAGPIDDELQAFLDTGEDPVLVTLGASSSAVAEDFFDLATHALDDLGARSIVVTGPAERPRRDLGSQSVVRRFVSFDAVLPGCRAIIHHGGTGTTVAAARAGIPQVAVPRGFDQPDNAALIEQHGLGVVVPWNRRHRHLTGAISRILDDETLNATAASIGASIRDTDGAACAADQLEDPAS